MSINRNSSIKLESRVIKFWKETNCAWERFLNPYPFSTARKSFQGQNLSLLYPFFTSFFLFKFLFAMICKGCQCSVFYSVYFFVDFFWHKLSSTLKLFSHPLYDRIHDDLKHIFRLAPNNFCIFIRVKTFDNVELSKIIKRLRTTPSLFLFF